MKKFNKPRAATIFAILDIAKFFLILMILMMVVNANAKNLQQAEETRQIADNTNRVVQSQEDILKAIKQVTDDTRVTAQQQTSIIICMLQVPIESRTTNLQNECRRQVAGEVVNSAAEINQGLTDTGSSSQPTPSPAKKQLEPSQSRPEPVTEQQPKEPSFMKKLLSPLNNLINSLRGVQ